MEIERKWIINGFPTDLKEINNSQIEQGYLSINPEVRIRSNTYKNIDHADYKLCIKGNGNISRQEIQTYISKEQYEDIKVLINKPMITKEYRQYELEDHLILECSLVDNGTNNSFYYAEVEFESEEQAKNFTLPFYAKEVTYDNKYKMKNYWKRTRL